MNADNSFDVPSAYAYDNTVTIPVIAPGGVDATFWTTLADKLDKVNLSPFLGNAKAIAEAKKKILIEHVRDHCQDIPSTKGNAHKALRDKLDFHLADVYRNLTSDDMKDLFTRARGRLSHIKNKLGYTLPHDYVFVEQGLIDPDRHAQLIADGRNAFKIFEAEVAGNTPIGRYFQPGINYGDFDATEMNKFCQRVRELAGKYGVNPLPIVTFNSSQNQYQRGVAANTSPGYPPTITLFPKCQDFSEVEMAAMIDHELTHAAQAIRRAAYKSSQSYQPTNNTQPTARPPRQLGSDKYVENICNFIPSGPSTHYDSVYGKESEREAYIRQTAFLAEAAKSNVLNPPPKTGIFHNLDLNNPGLDLRISMGKVIEKEIKATLR